MRDSGITKSDFSPAELTAAKSGTTLADLSHFGLIRLAGGDAQPFLHGQLSCDVTSLQPGRAQYGSYNTPQGRMLASFLLWRDEHGYVMQLPRSLRESIRKRLSMHILRSKVKATDISDDHALIGIYGARAEAILKSLFKEIPAAPLAMVTDQHTSLLRLDTSRFEIMAAPERATPLWNALNQDATPVSQTVWNWTDIKAGIPYITPATQEQFVPQMANLDLIGGVSFSKGCYPGQEIVARMHFRGKLKQRMYLANVASEAAPQPGDKLYSAGMGDQATGNVVNAAPSPDGGYDVLAVIRIDRVLQGSVHWKSLAGPPLEFLDLPYKL